MITRKEYLRFIAGKYRIKLKYILALVMKFNGRPLPRPPTDLITVPP
jgi:hypothetical protein